jgi:coenzyme PQQ precursor peptide PqqA
MQWRTPNLTNLRFGFEFTMYIAARQVHEGRLARPFFSGRPASLDASARRSCSAGAIQAPFLQIRQNLQRPATLILQIK